MARMKSLSVDMSGFISFITAEFIVVFIDSNPVTHDYMPCPILG